MGGGAKYDRFVVGADEFGGVAAAKVSKSGHLGMWEYAHRAAHEDGFAIASLYSTGVLTTAPLVLLARGSTDYEIHSHFDVMASGGAKMEIHQHASTAVTANGTAMTVCRVHRGSTVGDTERIFTYYTPTISSAGTLLLTQHNGGTTATTPQASIVGGGTRNGEEFILPASGSPITITITPDANATKIGFFHEYYEV
jgi:hypothetical protein